MRHKGMATSSDCTRQLSHPTAWKGRRCATLSGCSSLPLSSLPLYLCPSFSSHFYLYFCLSPQFPYASPLLCPCPDMADPSSHPSASTCATA